MSNFVVGLTGGIASGKSTVANAFAKLGIVLVDADVVARDVVEIGSPCLAAIVEKFGQQILLPDQSLDRAALRSIIFADPSQKQWLNDLMHPLIRQQILTSLNLATSPYCILVAPLLFENQLERYVDTTLAVDVPEETQVARTVERDGVSEKQVQAIIQAQINRQQRVSKADDVIDNQQSWPLVAQQIPLLHAKYLDLAKKKT